MDTIFPTTYAEAVEFTRAKLECSLRNAREIFLLYCQATNVPSFVYRQATNVPSIVYTIGLDVPVVENMTIGHMRKYVEFITDAAAFIESVTSKLTDKANQTVNSFDYGNI